ncbi:hypothetical protein B9Z55_021054 [Caenorhabditis nigoni]|uniref:Lin-15A/B-like domain-containing protein n=1 Tax=Caenorhabditis nigoni TaxID=1611254 RepID=A0A2G5TR66_9PELO|nr:hypothetical protein B9Z55_021054 [Caenorhabditis nigoni]
MRTAVILDFEIVRQKKYRFSVDLTFNYEAFSDERSTYQRGSHRRIQTIIDDNDGKLKFASTTSEELLRSFIRRSKQSIKERKDFRKERKLRKRICQVCHMNKPHSEFYGICSKRIRLVIMVGCLLRGTHSVEQAKLYTMNINGTTCYSHRQESIDVIFDYLGISESRQFFGCPRITMAGLMDIAKNFDSNITVQHFFRAFSILYMRKPKNVPNSL